MNVTQKQISTCFSYCFAALAMLFSAALGISSIPASSSRSFSTAVLVFFFLIYCGLLLVRPIFKSKTHLRCAIVLGFCGLMLRLSLFQFASGDYVSFLSVWTDTMRTMSVSQALSTPIGDYNMPYLYLILLISRLPCFDLYCIKLFSILADLILVLVGGKLVGLFTENQTIILLSMITAFLAPTTWLNSAYWGQCDSIYAALALLGLYYGLSRRGFLSMVFFALGFSFKLQTIFLLPVIALLLVTDRVKLQHLVVFPVTFFLVMVPALLGGRSLGDTFSIYANQVSAYPYLSLNAPSFWSLIDNGYYSVLGAAPTLLAIILTLSLLFFYTRKFEALSTATLLELSFILCLMVPWLLPKMHERYFYLAEILSIVYVAIHPKRLPVAIVQLFGGFLIYSAYLFGRIPILSLQIIAVIYGLSLIYLLLCCGKATASEAARIKEATNHVKH